MKCRYCEQRGLLLGSDSAYITNANRFLAAVLARGLSSKTVRAYAYALVGLSRWLLATSKVFSELTQADLLDYVIYLRTQGALPRTINHRLIVVQVFFRFCNVSSIPNHGQVHLPSPHYRGPGRDHNLGLNVRHQSTGRMLRVKESRKLIEPLTPAEVRLFLKSLRRYRDLAMIYLMLLCGLRSQEVLRLNVEDVDLMSEQMRVSGKGDKQRMMPLPLEVREVIQKYFAFERPRNLRTSLLFVVLQGRQRGYPMTAAGLRSLFRHRRLITALERANAHRLRHTFGADMARSGVQLPVLQKMMGHASSEMTLQYINLSLADIVTEFNQAMSTIRKRYEAAYR